MKITVESLIQAFDEQRYLAIGARLAEYYAHADHAERLKRVVNRLNQIAEEPCKKS